MDESLGTEQGASAFKNVSLYLQHTQIADWSSGAPSVDTLCRRHRHTSHHSLWKFTI